MINKFPTAFLASLLWGCGMLLWASCASAPSLTKVQNDPATIERLQRRIAERPDDAKALRDLGIVYLSLENYGKANETLQLAFSRDPNDPATLFHLGLVNEGLGKPETALGLYENYTRYAPLSTYRRLMAGRYAWVTREMATQEMKRAMQMEGELETTLEPRIVAVYPFSYQGSNKQYEPLGRGLAEMISTDLSKVHSLRLVERARLQALLDEIEATQGEAFETAPRVGKLVGAGRLVGGVYNVLSDQTLRLDASLWETQRGTLPGVEGLADNLSNFFALEKQLVFGLLEELQIELSAEEREAIEFIPTQNLQAFLAFSRGLEREDAGAFGEAADFYGQASKLDPNFQEATVRAEEVGGMSSVQGPVPQAFQTALVEEPLPGVPAGESDLLGHRLLVLNENLGVMFKPGIDRRESAAEAGTIEALGTLPDPPNPPGQNKGAHD